MKLNGKKIISHLLEYWPFYLLGTLFLVGLAGRLFNLIPEG